MRKRRGHGEGSVFRRKDSQWCASVTSGYGVDGKRRRRSVYGATKQQALAKLAALQHSALAGPLAAPQKGILSAHMARWLDVVMRPRIRSSTFARSEEIARLHIFPHLGGIVLSRLNAHMIQEMLQRLESIGRSPRVREMAYKLLSQALKQALRWGEVSQNVMDAVDKPHVPRAPLQVWSKVEALLFLDTAKKSRLYALYLLAITTGMRQGELLALQWQDIDLSSGSISVRFLAW